MTAQPDQWSETGRPRYEARELTGEDRMAEIVLDGQIYTLRITKSQKLILTK